MHIRPIIFRGKRLDNGEWVEGDLICNDGASHPKIKFAMEHYPTPIETKRLDFKRICTGYAYKESETFLNFDYIRPHLARQIGKHLLKENMIQFSIDDKNRDMNIIRAEVLAARPLEDDFQ